MSSFWMSDKDAEKRKQKFQDSLDNEGISNFNTSDDIKEKFNFWKRMLKWSILLYSLLLILALIGASSFGLYTLYENYENNYDDKKYQGWKITSWAGLGLGIFCFILLIELIRKWNKDKKYVTAAEDLAGAMSNVYTRGQTTKLLHSSMARLISRNDYEPEVEALRKHFETNDESGGNGSYIKNVFDQINK